jgi:hypothetical protein
MSDEPLDSLGRPFAAIEPLLEALAASGAAFLVAGGVAVSMHGYVRATVDLDIMPSPRETDLSKLAQALRALGAQAVGAGGERLPLSLDHPASLSVGNYFLVTELGALDLLNGPRPDLKRYLRLDAAAIEVRVGTETVKVISKDDLIAMKREAGRPKDLRDIAALTEVERNG